MHYIILDLAKTYLISIKSNSSLASTRRLNKKAFLIAKLAYICLNIYESLLSYLAQAKKKMTDFTQIEYLTSSIAALKSNIDEAIYEKYRKFETDLFSVFHNALVFTTRNYFFFFFLLNIIVFRASSIMISAILTFNL